MGEQQGPERLVVGCLVVLGLAMYVVAWNPDWSAMDSSDVVALVAVITSAIVGLAGLLSGLLAARADRTHAAEMAIQDRRQALVETAYVDLLTYAAAVGSWAQALLPPTNSDPHDPARDAPSLPHQADEWSVAAQVAAFGSGEVRKALDTWRLALRAVETKGELEDVARSAERDARARLQELVAAELDELKGRR